MNAVWLFIYKLVALSLDVSLAGHELIVNPRFAEAYASTTPHIPTTL